MNRIAWLIPLLISACDSSAPSTTQACADLAKARCAKRMSCSDGAAITRDYGDMNTCLTREQLSCTIGVAAPSTGITADAIEACVAAYPGFACADFFSNLVPSACVRIGPRAAGAACAIGAQCASSYCANAKTSGCGTCGDGAAAGQSCATTACARGLNCVSRTQVCQPPGTGGAACDPNSTPCGLGLSCQGTGTARTCTTAVGTAGAMCGGTIGGCDGSKGLTCGGAAGAKTCVAIPFAANGMPCGTLTDGSFAGCAAGGECFTATGPALVSEMGTCKTAAADGMPCDIALGPPCLQPARCITSGGGTAGVCTVPSGATCG
jgi:hypothetical protein